MGDEHDLFIIAAGGTGAKVCEAFIHLCAAGLGPPEVHVLLVDGDTANGNRARTVATFSAYERVQGWPWTVQPRNQPAQQLRFFRSKITIYSLAERFAPVTKAGLLPQILGDDELEGAMRVLLDESELSADLSVGFTGRPNLGSVVMERHLRNQFRQHKEAKAFVEKMITSSRAEANKPRVLVVGSVFGGTGASLLPVIQRCIKSYFEDEDKRDKTRAVLFTRLQWGKIMQLPYFYPEAGERLKLANPNRHLTDTANALWYYGETADGSAAEPIYLIGSESPQQRTTRGADGGADQVNPAFYHEVLAALAVLDFYREPTVKNNRPVRHYGNSSEERCALEKLPAPAGLSREDVLQRLAALLHLAAFVLTVRADTEEYRRGLFQYAKQATLTGWHLSLQQLLESNRASLTQAGGPGKGAVEYFGRLLLWAATTLGSAKHGTTGLDFSTSHLYGSLHNTLCCVNEQEVCVGDDGQPFAPTQDNLAARLCRLALVGLIREQQWFDDGGARGHSFASALRLLEDSKLVHVGLPPETIGDLLLWHDLDRQEVNDLCQQYGLPEHAPKTQG